MSGGLGLTGVFDGTFDGLLCIVYSYYYDKNDFTDIESIEHFQQSLAPHIYIATDYEKAVKVQSAIAKKISPKAEYYAHNAFLSYEEDRFTAIYHYILKGFKEGRRIDEMLSDKDVFKVQSLAKNVGREAHLLTGFCRFAKTEGGIYYSVITPKCRVLPILSEHFSDRLKNQPWIIHDKTHHMASIYDCEDYIITSVPENANIELSENEELYKNLWKIFHKTIAIEERKNYKCQRTMLPLWYRKNMVEFEE
ncbi:TIGR03915 family putative DNA repair protein [Anaeropeptidivorans aminofermentans]|jgi:probable DNA metabolism protein|uniref:TIGR03915 family putative DNA repair protein n=1 Tax=Anaeropeptidivorans aminofermentans TaxID=2934315 RepID=UPI002023F8DE|nr:TIGR03915 family putative DNA repair protein [Anaeropeptidivorans aminofermentans]MBE6011375.1 DNA metabolism protein [Lachnospiraceae bacterium]